MLLQVVLILNYICVLVIKTCDPSLEHMSIIEEERVAKAICSSYGLGDTASCEGARRRRKVVGVREGSCAQHVIHSNPRARCSATGFSAHFTLAGIYVLFLVFGLVVLAMLLIAYGVECASIATREGRVQPIRLRHTDEPPELSLAKDQRFYIFLSRTPRPR